VNTIERKSDAARGVTRSLFKPPATMNDSVRRVLFVDDDAVIRMITGALLQRAGYEVANAEDGAEALRIVESEPSFDLIVTDLDMPNVDGRTLLTTLRARETTASTPVVILSGSNDATMHAALLEAGALACITKPINPATFVEQLHSALRASN
jgi:two-component system chemotaxis response regulator CheY